MDPTYTGPESDVTLGEVNRNVNRVEKSLSEAIKGLVSRAEFNALAARVAELEASQKSKVTNLISIIGIVVSTAVAIWAVVHA